MVSESRVLAVIPARGDSKGLPGKNIRPLAGLPLIVHSIRLAHLCPAISRTVVSTDSPDIAEVARGARAEVPFMRPAELARDDTPMWPVEQHALSTVEEQSGDAFDYVLLLDPTSPARLPEDIARARDGLQEHRDADGIVGVSRPRFNPVWHCVVERDGLMTSLIEGGERFARRQEVPPVYRINGSLYLWRAGFVRSKTTEWRRGRHLIYEIPEQRAMSIDDIDEFEMADILIKHGRIQLPWLP